MKPHPSYSTECTRPTRYICSYTFLLYVPPPPPAERLRCSARSKTLNNVVMTMRL